MANKNDTEARLAALEEQNRLLRQMLGLEGQTTAVAVTDRKDFVEHGSEKHAIFLGLIQVSSAELEEAEKNKFVLYDSSVSGKTWRLEDELTVSQAFPTLDPDKAILMVLRQKVSELESGKPTIPDTAPPLLVPQSAF